MKKYQIVKTIPKADGTEVYCINEQTGEIFGTPIYKEVYKGTKEECENKLKELSSKE